jgi:hypothetical protein
MIAITTDILAKIAEANLLGRRYFKIVSDNYKAYIYFAMDVLKNPEKVAVILGPTEGAKFLQDRETIIFPALHENDIIASYKLMIFKIFNNFLKRHASSRINENEDEAFSYGQESLRRAVWNYTDTNFKFVTYAYHAIESGINDCNKNLTNKIRKNKEYSNTMNTGGDEGDSNSSFADQDEIYSFRKYQSTRGSEHGEHAITKLVKDTCKSEFEIEMVNIWLDKKKEKEDWVPSCREAYKKHYNKEITDAGIREKWRRFKIRVAKLVKSLNIRHIDILAE